MAVVTSCPSTVSTHKNTSPRFIVSARREKEMRVWTGELGAATPDMLRAISQLQRDRMAVVSPVVPR